MKLLSEQKAESFNYSSYFVGEYYKEYLKVIGLPEYHYYKGTAEYNAVLADTKNPGLAFQAGDRILREFIKTQTKSGTQTQTQITKLQTTTQPYEPDENIITINDIDELNDANEFDMNDDEIYEYPQKQRYGAPDYFRKHYNPDCNPDYTGEYKFWEDKAAPPHLRKQRKEKTEKKKKDTERFTLMDEFPDFSAFDA